MAFLNERREKKNKVEISPSNIARVNILWKFISHICIQVSVDRLIKGYFSFNVTKKYNY